MFTVDDVQLLDVQEGAPKLIAPQGAQSGAAVGARCCLDDVFRRHDAAMTVVGTVDSERERLRLLELVLLGFEDAA